MLPFHDRFHRFRVNRWWNRNDIVAFFEWKRIPITGALGPVTISLRFHLLFTRKRWRRLWKRKHLNTQTKLDLFENARIWKRNDLKTHSCNRGLSWRQVCYKNLIHYIKVSLVFDLNDDNSLSRKLFTSTMRYAIQAFKLHSFGREKAIFLGLTLHFVFLRSCLTSFHRQVLPKVTTYSDRANIVQIHCPQLFDDYKVKAQWKYAFGF